MTNLSKSDLEISRALEVLKQLPDELSFEKICEMSAEQMETYKRLLMQFKKANGTNASDQEKGKALEELVSYLLKVSGEIFRVDRNLRTTTNEIDQMVTLKVNGKVLLKHNIINSRFDCFLCECKNYSKSVDVTYTGKFCSLMLTNNVKLGILFSYYGVSGMGWSNSSGLIKKFYLHKEKVEDRYCIINFSLKEFESILEGKNFLQIVEEQLISLQVDTDYSRYLAKHPAEK